MAQRTEAVSPAVRDRSESDRSWHSEDVCDRVRGLIYEEYGRQTVRYQVTPLYHEGSVGRWRVTFRGEANRVVSSFRVVAEITPDGLVKREITKDRDRGPQPPGPD